MLPFPNSLFSVIPWENKFPGKQLLNCGNTVQKPFGKHYRSDEKGTGKQKCWTKEKNKERWKTLNLSLKKANLLWMKEKGKGGEAFWQLSTQSLPLSISPLFLLVSAKGNRVDIDQDLETFSPGQNWPNLEIPTEVEKKGFAVFPFLFFQKLHHQSFDGKKITNFCHRQMLASLCRHLIKYIFLLCFFSANPVPSSAAYFPPSFFPSRFRQTNAFFFFLRSSVSQFQGHRRERKESK